MTIFGFTFLMMASMAGMALAQDAPFPVKYENVWYDIQSLLRPINPANPNVVRHPGGANVLLPYKGKDITPILNGFHRFHRSYLEKCPQMQNYQHDNDNDSYNVNYEEEGPLMGGLERFTDEHASGGKLGLLKTPQISHQQAQSIHQNFRDWVLGKDDAGKDKMPCIAAKTALCKGSYGFFISHAPIGSREAALHHMQAIAHLKQYQTLFWKNDEHFTSIIGIFPNTKAGDNREYEKKIFQHQQFMLDMDPHDLDNDRVRAGNTVSGQDSDFHFSVHGRRYFVVGLSPVADRTARRAPDFGMAFNAKEQFEWLASTKQFTTFSDTIRKRDKKISGNVNPNIDPGNKNQTEGWETSGVDHSQEPGFVVPLTARPLKDRIKNGEVLGSEK